MTKGGLDAFYRGAAEHFHDSDATVGGGSYKMGGVKDLIGYESAVISKAKEKLIRDIARAAKKRLNISGLNPDAKDVNDIVKQFVKQFPDPSRNRMKFNDNKKVQEKVCHVMAEIINKEFASKVIDTKAELPEMCESISEVMNTLFVGMQGEFVTVRNDVRRSLANLETLRMYLEQTHSALAGKLAKSDDPDIRGASSGIRELNRAINAELNRQIKLLENMLNVVAPAEKSLGELLHKQKDLKLLVGKIKASPGSAPFGEKVSYMLSGIGATAHIAAVVDAALKKLGVSVKDYAGAKSLKDLKNKIQDAALDKMDDAGSTEELLKMLKAVDVIIRNDYRHDDIVKHLQGKVGGAVEKRKKSSGKSSGKTGGVKLDKRIKRTKDIRTKLFKIFNERLNDIFHKVSASSQIMVKKIGTEIPLGDSLRKFVNAFDMLDNFRQMNIYYSLSGYSRSIQAKETREKFISKVNNVIHAIEALKNVKNVPVLGDLNTSFKSLISLIEEMDGAFEKVPAVAPKYCDSKEAAKSGAQEGAQTDAGRADEEILGGSELSEITRVAYTLEEAKKAVKYYYYTARARSGFDIASKELESIRCEYPKVLGEAIAQKRDENNKRVTKYNKQIKDDEKEDGISRALNGASMNDDNEDTKKELEKKKAAVVKFASKKANAKDGLYKVAEAVDRFMIEFTDAALKNPDDIEDIKLMLDSTEIVSKWFTEKSGDMLCEFFEEFPSEIKFGTMLDFGGAAVSKDTAHYFTMLNLDPDEVCFKVNTKGTAPFDEGSARELHAKINNLCGPDAQADFETYQLFDVNGNKGVPNQDNGISYGGILDWVTDRANSLSATGIAPNEQRSAIKCRVDLVRNALKGKYKIIRPGHPFIAKDIECHEDLCDKLTKSLDNLSVLKNIVATFTSIGKKLGGESLYKKTNMTPYQIYSSLVEYVKCSALEHRADRNPKGSPEELLVETPEGDVVGVTDGKNYLINDTNKDMPFTSKRGYRGDGGYLMATPITGALLETGTKNVRDIFNPCACDDELFCMVIKSMVAKVFTVLGIYNLLNKPIAEQSFGKNFTDVRLVLGGNDEAYPKILDGAVELYVRLPLLAEFYRIVFDFDNLKDANENMITMVPDESGTFGPFIDIMFNKTRYVTEGTYSSTDVINIIREINRIYSNFSGSKSVVSEVVGAFVTEVNQRFGLLDRKTRLDYLKDKYQGDLKNLPEEEDLVNLSILPGGEYADEPTRPAYSDRYRRAGEIGSVEQKYKYEIKNEHKDYVDRLRGRISEQFAEADDIKDNFDMFDKVVRAKKEELKYARGDSERFAIALSAVNGFGAMSTSAIIHSMVLFHETVVTGLNSLNVLYTSLREMYDRVEGMDSALKIINKYYDPQGGRLDNPVNVDDDSVKDLKRNLATEYIRVSGIGEVRRVDQGGALTLGALLGLNATDPAVKKQKSEVLNRYVFDFERAFQQIVEILDQYGDGNLIEVKIDGCLVHMNSSKLREHVHHIIDHLKMLFDKFRGIIPNDILQRYESYSIGGNPNKGSLYFLEEEFLQKFLIGKVRTEGEEGEERFVTDTLDKINTYLKPVVDHLTGEFSVDVDGTPKIVPANGDAKKNNVFVRLSELTHWNPNTAPAKLTGTQDLNNFIQFIFTNTTGKKIGTSESGSLLSEFTNYTRSRQVYKSESITDYRSILSVFNQLLINYMKTFYDEATHKIYTPLINEFATGTFSTQVMKLKTINDLIDTTPATPGGTAPTPVNVDGLDVPSSALLASIGLALREIITRAGAGGLKHHLENDMAEIPMYMKESYKAYLPVYHKLFKSLRDRAELLLNLSKELNIESHVGGRSTQAVIQGISELNIPASGNASNTAMTAKVKSLLTQIMDGSRSIENMIESVLEEINDSPKYLETYTGSIKDFKSDEGKLPLMPVSAMTHYLSRKPGAEYSAWPWHTVATPEYKLLFGSRGQLCGKVSYEDAPSFGEMVSFHNQTTTSRHHVSEKLSADLFRNTVNIIRYVADLRQYNHYLGASDNFVAKIKADHVAGADNYAVQQTDNATCAYRDPLQATVEIVESKNVKSRRGELAACIEPREKCQSRAKMRATNILDLNIVPINMHMLAREIPLINLYNYSYTFDKLITEMLLGRGEECPSAMPNEDSGSFKKALCYLTCKPYSIIESGHTNPLVERIVSGGLGLGLGKPKFLSDELYNKCLLTSLYQNTVDYTGKVNPNLDEGGATIHNLKVVVDNINNRQLADDFANNSFMGAYTIVGSNITGLASALSDTNFRTSIATDSAREKVRKGMVKLVDGLASALSGTPPTQIGDAGVANAIINDESDIAQTATDDKYTMSLSSTNNREALRFGLMVYLRLAKHYYGLSGTDVDKALTTLSHVTYLDSDDKLTGKRAKDPNTGDLTNIGIARFNTKLIRNLFWFVNLQRLMRLKMRKDLMWYNTAVVSSHAVVNEDITETHGN